MPAYTTVDSRLLVLPAKHDQLLACFACLACLLVGLSCQLCMPTLRLLAGWFCLLSITSYWLVLPACFFGLLG
jgi:hypothetical protein